LPPIAARGKDIKGSKRELHLLREILHIEIKVVNPQDGSTFGINPTAERSPRQPPSMRLRSADQLARLPPGHQQGRNKRMPMRPRAPDSASHPLGFRQAIFHALTLNAFSVARQYKQPR
jgi:hypothetical protein